MANGKVWGFVLTGISLLTWFGFRKYREVKALEQLVLSPGKPAFQLVRVNGGLVDCLVNLVLKNPTPYRVYIKNLRSDIFIKRGNDIVKLGQVQATALVNPNSETILAVPGQLVLSHVLELGRQFFLVSTATIFLRGSVFYVTSGIEVPVPFDFSFDARQEFLNFLKA